MCFVCVLFVRSATKQTVFLSFQRKVVNLETTGVEYQPLGFGGFVFVEKHTIQVETHHILCANCTYSHKGSPYWVVVFGKELQTLNRLYLVWGYLCE